MINNFNLLKNKLNPLWVIYFLIIFGVVFAVLSLIQIYYNPLSAIWQNRFNGIAPHPIFASIIYSVTLSSSLALLSIDKSKFYWYLASIFFLVLLILTGSRSGLLLFVLQSITFFLLGLILEKKISYISVILFFNLAVLVGVFVVLFPDAFADLGFRSISSKDTRTEVWTSLFGSFLDSPWEGSELNKSSENTYLLFLSRLGIVFLPLLLFILMHFSIMTGSLYKRVESFHPTMSLEAKVIFKYQFSLFFGFFVLAVFEGFGSDLMSYSVIILLISTGTLGYFYDEYA